jgi:hypothetical protein
MAMGMVRKPLVKMDNKYIRDQATPDYVTFQDMFRKVGRVMQGCSSEEVWQGGCLL